MTFIQGLPYYLECGAGVWLMLWVWTNTDQDATPRDFFIFHAGLFLAIAGLLQVGGHF